MTELTLPVVVGAALADSINPCAFAVLLSFIAATLVLAERASAGGGGTRRLLWRTGGVYVLAIFLTYLARGLGFLSSPGRWPDTRVGRVAGCAIGIGLGSAGGAAARMGVRFIVPAGCTAHERSGAARQTPAIFAAACSLACHRPCSAPLPGRVGPAGLPEYTWRGLAY